MKGQVWLSLLVRVYFLDFDVMVLIPLFVSRSALRPVAGIQAGPEVIPLHG